MTEVNKNIDNGKPKQTEEETVVIKPKVEPKKEKPEVVKKPEKTAAEKAAEAKKLAEENGVILAEAMTLYHMPLYKKLYDLTHSGALGELKMIQMNFGSYKEYDMKNRFFNPNLAGGALLDIGVYALSFVRWFMSENELIFSPHMRCLRMKKQK